MAVEVQFYGVETKGSLSAVFIDFTDGAQFAMGCAGHGSVYVFRSRGDKENAPGFVTERRTVADLNGELRGMSTPPRALRLEIGEHELQLLPAPSARRSIHEQQVPSMPSAAGYARREAIARGSAA